MADPTPFVALMQSIWQECDVDENERVSGTQLRPAIQRSGLSDSDLYQIWNLVDTEGQGSVSFVQLGYVLGLISQKQRGEALEISNLNGQTAPPTLNTHEGASAPTHNGASSSVRPVSPPNQLAAALAAGPPTSPQSPPPPDAATGEAFELYQALRSEESLKMLGIPIPGELCAKIDSLRLSLASRSSVAFNYSVKDSPKTASVSSGQAGKFASATIHEEEEVTAKTSVGNNSRSSRSARLLPPAETVKVMIADDGRGTGLVFGGAKDAARGEIDGFGVYIKALRRHSPAAECGKIDVGMQLLSLNGHRFDGRATFSDLQRALLLSPRLLKLELLRDDTLFQTYASRLRTEALLQATTVNPSTSVRGRSPTQATDVAGSYHDNIRSENLNSSVVDVDLVVDERGTGLKFRGPKNDVEGKQYGFGVFIKSIKENTVASECKYLQVGMQVLSLNGIDMSLNGTFEKLKLGLAKTPNVLSLKLCSDTTQNYARVSVLIDTPNGASVENGSQNDSIAVYLRIDHRGTGLTFGGAKNMSDGKKFGYGVFLKGVKPDTIAGECGKLFAGQLVLSLNGIDLCNDGTFEKLKTGLRITPEVLALVVSRGVSDNYKAYIRRRDALFAASASRERAHDTTNEQVYAAARSAGEPVALATSQPLHGSNNGIDSNYAMASAVLGVSKENSSRPRAESDRGFPTPPSVHYETTWPQEVFYEELWPDD